MKSYRLTVHLQPARPDQARLIEAIEDVPDRDGRRQWLRDVLVAGFRKVGAYDRWADRLRGRVPDNLAPTHAPDPDTRDTPPSSPAPDVDPAPGPSPLEDTDTCDTLNLL